jgi:hypothetical protein
MTVVMKTRLVRGKLTPRLDRKKLSGVSGEQIRKLEAQEDWEQWRGDMLRYLKEKDEPVPVSEVYRFFGWPPGRPGALVAKFPTTFVTWKETPRNHYAKKYITMVDIHAHHAQQQPSVLKWLSETQAKRIT